jgi:hypothetical protein
MSSDDLPGAAKLAQRLPVPNRMAMLALIAEKHLIAQDRAHYAATIQQARALFSQCHDELPDGVGKLIRVETRAGEVQAARQQIRILRGTVSRQRRWSDPYLVSYIEGYEYAVLQGFAEGGFEAACRAGMAAARQRLPRTKDGRSALWSLCVSISQAYARAGNVDALARFAKENPGEGLDYTSELQDAKAARAAQALRAAAPALPKSDLEMQQRLAGMQDPAKRCNSLLVAACALLHVRPPGVAML